MSLCVWPKAFPAAQPNLPVAVRATCLTCPIPTRMGASECKFKFGAQDGRHAGRAGQLILAVPFGLRLALTQNNTAAP